MRGPTPPRDRRRRRPARAHAPLRPRRAPRDLRRTNPPGALGLMTERVDLVVRAPHALTMADAGVGYRADIALAIDRGRIVALDVADEILAAYAAERTIDARHHVLLPGLIDAHMHTAMCLLRGLAQDTGNWMMYGVGPFSAH